MTRRLFFLDQRRDAVLTAMPDGRGVTVLAETRPNPDGIVCDIHGGFLYWTNMGSSFDEANGSIERSRLDGSERTLVVPDGATRTPKQLRLDAIGGHLYWCDREGMRIMRARLDGSEVETLVATGDALANKGDARRWCVGMALDLERRLVYWTQKGHSSSGQGRIFRAPMDPPRGVESAARGDIELLFDCLPEPVDLELSPDGGFLYWTDRSLNAGGGCIYRAELDHDCGALCKPQVLATGMNQPIGLTLDFAANRMFATDLGGNLYAGDLHGHGWGRLLSDAGKFTGICHL